MSERIKWIAQEVEILEKLHRAGKTLEDIGQVLRHRSLQQISCKMRHLGIKPNPKLPDMDIDFDLYRQWITPPERV